MTEQLPGSRFDGLCNGPKDLLENNPPAIFFRVADLSTQPVVLESSCRDEQTGFCLPLQELLGIDEHCIFLRKEDREPPEILHSETELGSIAYHRILREMEFVDIANRVQFTTAEGTIVTTLIEHQGQPVNRVTLYKALDPDAAYVPQDLRVINVHINRIRNKVNKLYESGGVRLIEGVREIGYRFNGVPLEK